MNVCACGNPMVKGEPWCKLCWATWTTWFMRANGKWIHLEADRLYGLQAGQPICNCDACITQRAIQVHVDELERHRRDRVWEHLHEPHDQS